MFSDAQTNTVSSSAGRNKNVHFVFFGQNMETIALFCLMICISYDLVARFGVKSVATFHNNKFITTGYSQGRGSREEGKKQEQRRTC